jgi:hypothetical protein
MPETKILGPHTLPPPRRLPEGRETQDLAGENRGEEESPPDSLLSTVEKERGTKVFCVCVPGVSKSALPEVVRQHQYRKFRVGR